MVVRRIVCLANSYKFGGRCVAGVELCPGRNFGHWIRPVTNRSGRAINRFEQTCTDDTGIELLDVLDIDFGNAIPEGHQPENILINPQRRWVKIGRLQLDDLAPILHCGHEPLWPHTESTGNGRNDKISANNLRHISSSLSLVRPARAIVRVLQSPYKMRGKLDVRVRFNWGREQNDLQLTDPKKRDYQDRGLGEYNLNNPAMCISIAEIFESQNAAFKLVAGLML